MVDLRQSKNLLATTCSSLVLCNNFIMSSVTASYSEPTFDEYLNILSNSSSFAIIFALIFSFTREATSSSRGSSLWGSPEGHKKQKLNYMNCQSQWELFNQLSTHYKPEHTQIFGVVVVKIGSYSTLLYTWVKWGQWEYWSLIMVELWQFYSCAKWQVKLWSNTSLLVLGRGFKA